MPQRLIDIPIESLPFVDEHYIKIAASTDEVWDALIETTRTIGSGRSGRSLVGALGCAVTDAHGAVDTVGSTVPGFVVTRSVPPGVLALMGEHRFSRYALVFRILEKPSGLMLLSAQTRAEFPGAKGRAYRRLVIGSRGHRLVITRILRAVRRRAERAHTRPRSA